MAKGKIAYFHNQEGQILSEGNVYNFNINNVKGELDGTTEFEFEIDNMGNLKVIYGKGAEKPQPKKKKQESKNTSSKILLTEEK
jgi:hypothetical protein